MAYPGPPHDQNPYPPSAVGHSQVSSNSSSVCMYEAGCNRGYNII